MNKELTQYFETALWSSLDEEGYSLDDNYDIDDIARASIETAAAELANFFELAAEELDVDDSRHAHDFWLTRNGHGAGFWDRGYLNGEKLTEMAKTFGPSDLYLGDGDQLYLA